MLSILIVYGDVGHSPRMQNHIRQLLLIGNTVILAGYAHSKLPKDISSSPKLAFVPIQDPPRQPQLGRIVGLCFRLLMLLFVSVHLMWTIFRKSLEYKERSLILIQNPPSLPSHLIGFGLAKLLGMRFIIDWHNFGFTLLGLKGGIISKIIRKAVEALELGIGRCVGDEHLVVSMAMSEYLKGKGFNNVIVVYDRPVKQRFKAISDPKKKKEERSSLLGKHFTILNLEKKANFIISSTSWTEDENFEYLLDALEQLAKINTKEQWAFLITGKGAGREEFERRIIEMGLPKTIEVRCKWLSSEDYVKALATADLGICVHQSSSGLDLPMKIVDMISVDLVVAALYYRCLEELLNEERRSKGVGMFFRTSEELLNLLLMVPSRPLEALSFPNEESFDEHWRRKLPHFL